MPPPILFPSLSLLIRTSYTATLPAAAAEIFETPVQYIPASPEIWICSSPVLTTGRGCFKRSVQMPDRYQQSCHCTRLLRPRQVALDVSPFTNIQDHLLRQFKLLCKHAAGKPLVARLKHRPMPSRLSLPVHAQPSRIYGRGTVPHQVRTSPPPTE